MFQLPNCTFVSLTWFKHINLRLHINISIKHLILGVSLSTGLLPMGKQQHESAPIRSNVEVDCDEGTFSFDALGKEKGADSKSLNHGGDTGLLNSNSPADVLFSNGQILPHAFPLQLVSAHSSPRPSCSSDSRSSSNGSNNSNSSRNSDRSSATKPSHPAPPNIRSQSYDANQNSGKRSFDLVPISGRSRSYDATPRQVPVSQIDTYPRRRTGIPVPPESKIKNRNSSKPAPENARSSKGFFRSLMAACRECHAIEPSSQVQNLQATTRVQV